MLFVPHNILRVGPYVEISLTATPLMKLLELRGGFNVIRQQVFYFATNPVAAVFASLEQREFFSEPTIGDQMDPRFIG